MIAAQSSTDTVSACVKLPARANVQVLAVAQTKTGTGGLAKFPPKGWAELHATGTSAGASTCASASDGGLDEDSGTGSEPNDGGSSGCSCRAAGERSASPLGAIAAIAAALALRARSSRSSKSRRPR